MRLKKYLLDIIENKNFHFSIALFAVATIFLWIINLLNIAYPVDITTRQASGELAVVGEGKVDVVPDTANVNLGIVVSNAQSVKEAQRRINEVNNAIIKSLKDLGVEEEDIKTSNYSINPDYNYQSGGNEITGYSGNATISIKVRTIDLLSEVITKGTESGANQILGTSFVIDEPERYRRKQETKR